jgi:hypothetical protein
MTERPDTNQPDEYEPDEYEPDESQRHEDRPDVQEATREGLPGAIGTSGPIVPVATGATSSYTTGTLEPGELGPAVDKPEDEGPTQGEGPITDPIQAKETGE